MRYIWLIFTSFCVDFIEKSDILAEVHKKGMAPIDKNTQVFVYWLWIIRGVAQKKVGILLKVGETKECLEWWAKRTDKKKNQCNWQESIKGMHFAFHTQHCSRILYAFRVEMRRNIFAAFWAEHIMFDIVSNSALFYLFTLLRFYFILDGIIFT